RRVLFRALRPKLASLGNTSMEVTQGEENGLKLLLTRAVVQDVLHTHTHKYTNTHTHTQTHTQTLSHTHIHTHTLKLTHRKSETSVSAVGLEIVKLLVRVSISNQDQG